MNEKAKLAEAYGRCEHPIFGHGRRKGPGEPHGIEAVLLADVCEETGVGYAGGLQAKGPDGCRFEISLGDRNADVPEDKLDDALRRLEEKIRAALKEKP